ncbi:MAG TPA: polyketide synthase, partial [Silvibacterium sp.]|nr:polyketide synthase [Silvibacterium sp.]
MADHLSPEKQTLLALRALRQRVDELEAREHEPIAIVGMACRFPGGASSKEYWDLLLQGSSAVTEIPRERMDLDPVFDSRPQTPGKTYSRWAGMLDKPGDFDAEFFGIAPREAVSMDPQQRVLLEVSWEALEDAGINPKALGGQQAGVFVGISTSEYAQLLQENTPRHQLTAYALQGSALNATAGRLSYFYGLNGPSMAIDTACSSSLVAVDRACRSLREGESQLAIAAGINIIATPESLIIASQWGMLSPSGKIRAFDASADGFVRGEGCGVLVLKRLSEAERAGDRILAVILGSAVNQDGASSGLT